MKMIKRTLIILIIAATIFTVVECSKVEDINNIKQELDNDVLLEEDKENTEEDNKEDKPKEDEKEEIEYPVELG